MTTVAQPTDTHSLLRWLADAYEQTQRRRLAAGEQIRAVVQGRDEVAGVAEEWVGTDADRVLAGIVRGETDGPIPALGRLYRRLKAEEDTLREDMMGALEEHPAWPWLRRVEGIGPTLAAKLLARLDVHRAPTASSFWAFAGLATVPGVRYRCDTCGLEVGYPAGWSVSGRHKPLGGGRGSCKGTLEPLPGEYRVAQRRPRKGEELTYSPALKKTAFLVASSFLRRPDSPYGRYLRAQRARLDRERPGWTEGRKHMAALRLTAKLFMSHLWEVWRRAEGLPVPEPYVFAMLGHTHKIRPEDMIEDEEASRGD